MDNVIFDIIFKRMVVEKAPEIEKSLTADSRPAADRIVDPRRHSHVYPLKKWYK